MNKTHYLIPITFGIVLSSLAILPGLIQQDVFASRISRPCGEGKHCVAGPAGTSSQQMFVSPAGLPQANTTGDNMTSEGGQANLTANKTGEQGMPSASPVGELSDPSCTITKGER